MCILTLILSFTGRHPGGTQLVYNETSLIDDATVEQYKLTDGAELQMVKSHISLVVEDNQGEVQNHIISELLLIDDMT